MRGHLICCVCVCCYSFFMPSSLHLMSQRVSHCTRSTVSKKKREESCAKRKTPDDMRVRSEEESTDLLSIANGSKRPHTSKPTGWHNVLTHFPIDPDCEVFKLTETSRAPCRNRQKVGDRVHHPHIFLVMLSRRITQFSVRRSHLVSNIVTQAWCRTFILIGFKATQ